MAKVLLVEYDQTWQDIAAQGLGAHRIECCPALSEALKRLEADAFDVIAVSLESNYGDNVRNLKTKLPAHTPVLVVSEQARTENVVEAIKKVPTGRAGHHSDVPTTQVVIESAEVISE